MKNKNISTGARTARLRVRCFAAYRWAAPVLIGILILAGIALHAQPDPDLAPNTPAVSPTRATTPATPPNSPALNYPRLTYIDSDSVDFDMNHHSAVYVGHVRVTEEDMKLTCMWLTANLPQSGRVNEIIAETNVVIDFHDPKGQTMHAVADKAVYHYSVENSVTNETVTLSGNASVEKTEGTFIAEPIVWDRISNHLTGMNERMIYRPSAHTETNAPATTNSPPATNAPAPQTNPPAELDTNAPVGTTIRAPINRHS